MDNQAFTLTKENPAHYLDPIQERILCGVSKNGRHVPLGLIADAPMRHGHVGGDAEVGGIGESAANIHQRRSTGGAGVGENAADAHARGSKSAESGDVCAVAVPVAADTVSGRCGVGAGAATPTMASAAAMVVTDSDVCAVTVEREAEAGAGHCTSAAVETAEWCMVFQDASEVERVTRERSGRVADQSVCVCGWVGGCARARVRLCVRACVFVVSSACECVCVSARVCMEACASQNGCGIEMSTHEF